MLYKPQRHPPRLSYGLGAPVCVLDTGANGHVSLVVSLSYRAPAATLTRVEGKGFFLRYRSSF